MSVGALVAAVAPTFEVLLGARVLQGAGAAAVPTLGVAVLSARYSGEVRGLAFGRLAGVAAAVSCLGPLIGGVVEASFGWRAVMALPILGALVIPFLWRALSTEGSGARLDIVGAILVALTAAGMVLLVQSPSGGLVVAAVGAALLVLGVPAVRATVRRRPDGFLPVEVIRNATVVRSAVAASAVPASWFAMLIALPAVLLSDGWEAWQVGLAMLPSAIVALVVPQVTGPLLIRVGPARALAIAGLVASVALLVATLGAWLVNAPVLVVGIVLVTIAFGLGQPALSAVVGDAVQRRGPRGGARGVDPALPDRRQHRLGRRRRHQRAPRHAGCAARARSAAAARSRRAGPDPAPPSRLTLPSPDPTLCTKVHLWRWWMSAVVPRLPSPHHEGNPS